MPRAPRPPPLTIRETPDDKARLKEMLATIGGSKAYVYRLALAHLSRKVRELLAAFPGSTDSVKAMIAPDIVTIFDPSTRGAPLSARGRVRRATKKIAKRAQVETAQPSAER